MKAGKKNLFGLGSRKKRIAKKKRRAAILTAKAGILEAKERLRFARIRNGAITITARELEKFPELAKKLGISAADLQKSPKSKVQSPKSGARPVRSDERVYEVSWYAPVVGERRTYNRLVKAASKDGAIKEVRAWLRSMAFKEHKGVTNFIAKQKQNPFIAKASRRGPDPNHQLKIVRRTSPQEAKCSCGKWSMQTSLPANTTEFQAQQYFTKWHNEHVALMRRAEAVPNPQQKFSQDTLRHLRTQFASIDRVNVQRYRSQVDKVFAATGRPLLKQLSEAKIEWISPLAKNALIARRNPAKKKNLHPLEVGSNVATILGGLQTLRQMMVGSKKTKSKAKKNFGLIGLVENLQAAEYLEKKLSKKKKQNNPPQTARAKIRETFLGRKGTGREMKLFTLPGGPKRVGSLAKLASIELVNGKVQNFPKGSAYIGGIKHGKLARMVIGLKQPFPQHFGPLKENGMPTGKPIVIGEVKRFDYWARKPHLYGEHSPEFRFTHKAGEEGGRPPLLVFHNGAIGFRGGDYKIQAEGVRD